MRSSTEAFVVTPTSSGASLPLRYVLENPNGAQAWAYSLIDARCFDGKTTTRTWRTRIRDSVVEATQQAKIEIFSCLHIRRQVVLSISFSSTKDKILCEHRCAKKTKHFPQRQLVLRSQLFSRCSPHTRPTLADEIGHNMGCWHDRDNHSSTPTDYSHGLRYCTGETK